MLLRYTCIILVQIEQLKCYIVIAVVPSFVPRPCYARSIPSQQMPSLGVRFYTDTHQELLECGVVLTLVLILPTCTVLPSTFVTGYLVRGDKIVANH